MRNLELVGLSADGRQVLFVDETGAQFATAADDRLRAALRGDRARLGQLDIEMTSALRPRDIQARIRSGDSPEDVAALAQVPVEKVMPYCLPVLAERQHVAETAQRSHVRRKGAEAASRALGEVTAERLRARGVDPRGVEWDAWRREDGRWDVQASYLSGDSQRSALFVFDAAGRYSFPEDDEAKWITGEAQSTSKGPQPREHGPGGERRLSAVRDDEDLLALSDAGERDGEDEGEAADGAEGADDDLTAVAKATEEPAQGPEAGPGQEPEARPKPARQRGSTQQADKSRPAITSFLDQALNRHHRPPEAGAEPDADREGDGEPEPEPVPAPAGDPTRDGAPEVEHSPGRKRRGRRASVPSWDEIMFGKDDEPPGPPE